MSLHLILGSMYSGKTTELIRLLSRYESIGKKVCCINSVKDTRADGEAILTHDHLTIPACKVEYLKDATIYYNADVIGIDEAQFFPDLLEYTQKMLKKGFTLIVSGLDGDYQQEKFGHILDLIPMSDSYEKVYALCQICGQEGPFTKRINKSKEQILVGSKENYIAVCRKHL